MSFCAIGITNCSECGKRLQDNENCICKECENKKIEIQNKIEKDIKNREFEQKIIKVLENVGYTRGVLTYENDKNVYITGEQMNNYLACITLAELIRTGALELNFKEEKNERKMKYLKKLLKEG